MINISTHRFDRNVDEECEMAEKLDAIHRVLYLGKAIKKVCKHTHLFSIGVK